MKFFKITFLQTVLILILINSGCSTTIMHGGNKKIGEVIPHMQSHAHNDYEHERPLFDALSHGFCSIEADIHLTDGKLLIAHSISEVQEDRNLQSLYLDPLRTIVKKNKGSVYPDGTNIILLIDIKTEANSTYMVLREILSEYKEFLTTYSNNEIEKKAVTVIISGNRAFDLLKSESLRYAALDGRTTDLENGEDVYYYPLISENWYKVAGKFNNNFSADTVWKEAEKLIVQAHLKGQKVRFWNTPDTPETWEKLKFIGVDLINTDNLAGLEEFLRIED